MSSHAATPAASAVKPVVVVVDTFGGPIRHHNPELPLIYWDDAAVTRGDGVFETLLIRDGHACNLERHSKRFAASAALLGPFNPGRRTLMPPVCGPSPVAAPPRTVPAPGLR